MSQRQEARISSAVSRHSGGSLVAWSTEGFGREAAPFRIVGGPELRDAARALAGRLLAACRT